MRMIQTNLLDDSGCGAGESKQRQRWKDSTRGFREPRHCILHMYNNKHGNNINNKVYTHTNTMAHKALLNKSVKNKNKYKLHKCMQEAKWFFHTLTHPCKLLFCLAFILYLVQVIT